MSELVAVYYYVLPFVLIASTVEGLWQARSRPEGYDWKAWATSLVA